MKCDIKDLKVKGVLDESGVKNFLIETPDSGSYFAMRQPNGKFTVGDDGVSRTLKQCKEVVANDAVVFFADATEPSGPPQRDETWDCVHPCAMLAMIYAGVGVGSDSECISPHEIRRTLDAYGWIDSDGLIDVVAADENYEKWSK